MAKSPQARWGLCAAESIGSDLGAHKTTVKIVSQSALARFTRQVPADAPFNPRKSLE